VQGDPNIVTATKNLTFVDDGRLLRVDIGNAFGSMAQAVADWSRIAATARSAGRRRVLVVRHGEGPDARQARDLVLCLRDLGFADISLAIVWTNEAASHEKQFIEYLARCMGFRVRVCADVGEGVRYFEQLIAAEAEVPAAAETPAAAEA
jgi:hypothetical protein